MRTTYQWRFASWVLCLAAMLYCPVLPRCAAQQTRPCAEARTLPASRPTTSEPQTAPNAVPSLAECEALFAKGDYAASAKEYEKLISGSAGRVPIAVGLARAMSMQGQYAAALTALDRVKQAGAGSAEWNVAKAQLLSDVGRYEESLACVDRACELRPCWAPGIFIRGSVLETLGRNEQAASAYESVEDVLADETLRSDARSLVAIGQILDRLTVLTGQKASEQAQNILHNYFQEAYQRVDERHWSANVAAGMFLLSKHRPKLAAKEFQLADKLNPRIPDVFVGRGVVELSKWRFEQCLSQADRALKINPNHADALLLKAICLMQWRKFDEVVPLLDEILRTNPNHLEALSLRAAWHVRMGQGDQAEAYIDRVNAVNSRYAGLPNAIGQWLSAGRQFEKAETYYKRAIELAPHLADPLANLGLLYMQTGQEAQAKEILAKAHEIDDFRADVVNYSRVLDKLDDFEVRTTPHFVVKLDGRRDSVLLDQVADYLESMYGEVCADFSHEPSAKTLVEIFPTHPGFSLRISGRGWIGTVGASTGRVIVLVAPNKDRSQFGTYNWATVLRHEFAHTVTLSATGNRIPPWFTEACAVWEQPDRRNYDAVKALVGATQAGRLFPVKRLDWAFIRPKRRGDRSLAYAQAEWMMEYIITTQGFGAISKMLDGFNAEMAQAAVFAEVLGVTEAQFDTQFAAWAKGQVVQWGFEPEAPVGLQAAAKAAKDLPQDAAAQAAHADALARRGQGDQAKTVARKALELDEHNRLALGVLARLLAAEGEHGEAIILAERLESIDHASRVAPAVLAECYLARRDWARAIAALELLKQRTPLSPESYRKLAKLYVQLGQPARALPNLIELHRRTMNKPTYARQIADIYRSMGQDDKAMEYYRQVARIDPYEPSTYKAMAEICKGSGRHTQAVAAARNMTRVQSDSAEAWTYLAIAQYHLGRSSGDRAELVEARQAALKAHELDPAAPRVDELIGLIEAALGE